MQLRFLLCLPFLACTCLAEGPVVQTTNPLEQTPPPNFRTQTHAVVVDVVVTKGDEPALGLHESDFKVLEDGKAMHIDFFEEHSAKASSSGAFPELPKMPPNVYTNVPPAPEGDSVNILLLDTLNTDRQDQSYVHQQINDFLGKMQPGVRVAVFVLGSKLRMVQGFIADSSALLKAVNDPKNGISMEAETSVTRSMQDKADDLEDKKRLALINISPYGMETVTAAQNSSNGYQADQRIGMTLQALNYLGRYLAGVPGRKNLIWFSTSFPVTVFPSTHERQSFEQFKQFNAAIRETADLLTVSKVAVYPIGAEGMMAEHMYDPIINSRGAIDLEGGEVHSTMGPGGSPKGGDMGPYVNEGAARADKIMAMEELAADTGGKAFYNNNDLSAAVMRAIANGAHYYTIVYTPTNKKMDGKYRRIEVKTTAGKFNLAYRRGYNADDNLASVVKPQADPLHGLLMRGMPSSTQILYGVRVLPLTSQPAPTAKRAGSNTKLTGPTTRYGVDFMVRWTDLHLETASDGSHRGKLQASLIAYDREGNAVNWMGETQGMALQPNLFDAVRRSGIPVHLEIDLPANQELFLETGIYDWNNGQAGTLEVPIEGRPQTATATPPAK